MAELGPTAERDEMVRLIERTAGQPPPEESFEVIITGIARPMIAGDTAPTQTSLEDCFNPEAGTIDPISKFTFYPDTILPADAPWRRYRWRALHGNLDSEGCGWRTDPVAGYLKPWKQALYAVNTAEYTQDTRLDYPPIHIGTCLPMIFGDISLITGGVPTWGFYFHFMPDPKGILICNTTPTDPIGCCSIVQVGGGVTEICLTKLDCLALGGFWNYGLPCPSVPCE